MTALASNIAGNFLGPAAAWYKRTIALFLLLNPVLVLLLGPYVTGWLLLGEFIFCLAMALKCYPLQPCGLLALEAVLLGLTTPDSVFHETKQNFPVLLLLIFMVAGIYFLQDLLRFIFTRILLRIRSKRLLSLLFCFTAAFLSAFLDALTVTAVVIAVATSVFGIYHKISSGKGFDDDHDHADDSEIGGETYRDLQQLRAFLRNLVMHAAVGTALGGVTTLVGEPQNLLIGGVVGWEFRQFFLHIAPVSLPVLCVGLLTCYAIESLHLFGYGQEMPAATRRILEEFQRIDNERRTSADRAKLLVQAAVALFLVMGLALHWAEVGLIGLAVIVMATAGTGVVRHRLLGLAFHGALPFTALLVVFFCIVAVIQDQKLIQPVIDGVFRLDNHLQVPVFFLANGLLSAITDNVFVATVYINEVKAALEAGLITRGQFELMAIAINTGTNIPSVATPNGQAAFLFLLTSALAPLIRLGYGRMVLLALPYTLSMSLAGLLTIWWMA